MATGVSLTHSAEVAILNRVFRNNSGAPTFPATIYAALFTASPTEAGTLTSEIAVSGYSRQSVTFGAPVAQATGNQISNTGQEAFGTPATTSGEVATYLGLMDAATAGTMWAYGALDNPVTVTSGVALLAAIGAISFLLD